MKEHDVLFDWFACRWNERYEPWYVQEDEDVWRNLMMVFGTDDDEAEKDVREGDEDEAEKKDLPSIKRITEEGEATVKDPNAKPTFTIETFCGNVMKPIWEADPNHSNVAGYGSVRWYANCIGSELPLPVATIETLRHPEKWPSSVGLDALGYHRTGGRGMPKDFRQCNPEKALGKSAAEDWAHDMKKFWKVGEVAAEQRLQVFIEDVLKQGLFENRDRFRADKEFTAIISPYIRFGELSVKYCVDEANKVKKTT